jgi:hypothetical protein
VDPITSACAQDELLVSTVVREAGGAVLLMCGRYRLDAPDVPRRCGGGIILATVLESTEGAVKVYHEWCTAIFDAADKGGWPVPEADLMRHAEALIATTAFVPLAAAAPSPVDAPTPSP